jgi:hypothetical protein
LTVPGHYTAPRLKKIVEAKLGDGICGIVAFCLIRMSAQHTGRPSQSLPWYGVSPRFNSFVSEVTFMLPSFQALAKLCHANLTSLSAEILFVFN